MLYSGIIVTATPDAADRVAECLAALPGVEIHVRHEPSGRLVVVLESPDDATFEASFQRLRAQPSVVAVDLVYHFVDHESDMAGAGSGPLPVGAAVEGRAS